MKTRNILFYIFLTLTVLIDIFIIVEGGINGTNSASQSAGFTQWIISIVEKINPNSPLVTDPDLAHRIIRKLVGHFGLFGVSGIITVVTLSLIDNAYVDKKIQIILAAASVGLAVAFISELMQFITPGRYMSIIDVLIDYAGFVLFGGITFLIFYIVHLQKEKKKNVSSLG